MLHLYLKRLSHPPSWTIDLSPLVVRQNYVQLGTRFVITTEFGQLWRVYMRTEQHALSVQALTYTLIRLPCNVSIAVGSRF